MSALEGARGDGAAHGRDMPWWGWGRPEVARELPAHALPVLQSEFGAAAQPRPPIGLDEVALSESRLPDGVRDRLVAILGSDGVRDDRAARVLHTRGKSYPDLVRQRRGDCEDAPDAVVLPGDHAAVRAVLELCAAEGVAVVPWGGGTSVVGGLEPLRAGFAALIALDLAGLDRIVSFDERSRTVVAEAGLRAPEADALLARAGWTLGHIPQSYEFVSLGGCVATRSAGQASTGYGRIDELLLGARLAAPAGEVALPALPRNAAGPRLAELLAGSEGALGVLTEVALAVRPLPERRRYEGWFLRSWPEGIEALRALEHEQEAPDIARLSDEHETELSMLLAGSGGWKGALGRRYLRLRGYDGGCLGVFGWEGEADDVSARRERSAAVLRAHGAICLGQGPGRSWERNRFHTPYLRDDMIARGLLVETLETVTQWSLLDGLYAAVRSALTEALSARDTPPRVMCHVSHLYPSGASLYFTFIARGQAGEEVDQWRAAKTAACDAIVASGGSISHHHAVGADHAPWLHHEAGGGGLDLLRAAKAQLDPAGIMNPGKLLSVS